MSKIDSKGGRSASIGIRYQTYYAIYRFLIADTTEIILEWIDEDVVIINEDVSGPSLEFIQCKYVGEGPLNFNVFYNDVFRRFLEIHDEYSKDRKPEERYIFSLATNTGFDKNLDKFSKIPELIRNGVKPEGIQRLYGRTLLRKFDSLDYIQQRTDLFYCFQLLNFFQNRTEKWLKEEIHRLLISFGTSNPDTDTAKIFKYFLDVGSGKITKNKLRKDLNLDYPLFSQNEETPCPFNLDITTDNINNIIGQEDQTLSTLNGFREGVEVLKRGIDFGELTANQLSAKVNHYPLGALERRHVERCAQDTTETTSDIRDAVKSLESNIDSFQSKYNQLIRIRKAHDLEGGENNDE